MNEVIAYTDLSTEKMTDEMSRALLLNKLFSDLRGEGANLPEIISYMNKRTARHLSPFRLQNMIETLVKSKHIVETVHKTLGGRVYRRFSITTNGVALLLAYVQFLPRDDRQAAREHFGPVMAALQAVMIDRTEKA